jgi:hypothetical protein
MLIPLRERERENELLEKAKEAYRDREGIKRGLGLWGVDW